MPNHKPVPFASGCPVSSEIAKLIRYQPVTMYQLGLTFIIYFAYAAGTIGQATPEIKALIDSSRQYYYVDGQKTIGFAREALELAITADDYWGQLNASQMIGEGQYTLGNLDSATYYYDQAMELAERENDKTEIANNFVSLASIATQSGDHLKAISYYLSGIEIQEELDDSSGMCDALLRLGNVYSTLGKHAEAIENLLTSLRICEAIGRMQMVGYGYGAMAIVYDKQGQYDEAEKYFRSGLEVFTEVEDDYGVAGIANNMGIMYKNMGRYDDAIDSYERSLKKFEEIGYKPGINACNGNLGILYVLKEQFEAGVSYAEKALQLAIETSNRESEQDNLNTLAQAYLGLKDYPQATQFAERSLEIAEQLGSREKLRDVNLTLSRIYEELGRPAEALEFYKSYSVNKDSVFNAEQSRQINELRTLYETEKKDQEIRLLEKNIEIDKVKKTRLWTGLGLTFLLAVLVIHNLIQRRRKDRKIHKQQQEIERQKVKNIELERARLETELEFKQKELTAKVLQLARKNDFLQNLDQQVHKLRDQAEGGAKDEARKLSRMINRDVETETDWDDFLASFRQVHSEFIRQLTSEYPELSKNDYKLACLMKMNLSSKEIASALNISPAGIKKARYRLRKKLDLDPDVNIQEYFIAYPMN